MPAGTCSDLTSQNWTCGASSANSQVKEMFIHHWGSNAVSRWQIEAATERGLDPTVCLASVNDGPLVTIPPMSKLQWDDKNQGLVEFVVEDDRESMKISASGGERSLNKDVWTYDALVTRAG